MMYIIYNTYIIYIPGYSIYIIYIISSYIPQVSHPHVLSAICAIFFLFLMSGDECFQEVLHNLGRLPNLVNVQIYSAAQKLVFEAVGKYSPRMAL